MDLATTLMNVLRPLRSGSNCYRSLTGAKVMQCPPDASPGQFSLGDRLSLSIDLTLSDALHNGVRPSRCALLCRSPKRLRWSLP